MKLSSYFALLYFFPGLSAAEHVLRLGSTISSVRMLEAYVTGVNATDVNATNVNATLTNYAPSNETGAVVWTGAAVAQENRSDAGGGLGGVCFSSTVAADVLYKGPTAMEDVRVGDYVLTKSHQYQQVYAFAHHNPHRTSEFLQLYTTISDEEPLEMTRQHMIYKHGENNPVPADSIRVGDILRDEKNVGAEVTKISSVMRKGIFAPLTKDGTIVTNGIVSSCYIDVLSGRTVEDDAMLAAFWSSQDYIHRGLAPFRMLCKMSSGLCQMGNTDGMPHFISFGLWLTHLVCQIRNTMCQWMCHVAYGVITGVFFYCEPLFQVHVAFVFVTAMLISNVAFRKRDSEAQKDK